MADAAYATDKPAKSDTADKSGGSTEPTRVREWIDDIQLALREREPWCKQNRQIIKRYRMQERINAATTTTSSRRMSLFWSNIEVLKPATLANIPKCVVSRRYMDEDPLARMTSEVLERSVNFNLDTQDLADILMGARNDYLLVGQGQVWLRYQPTLRKTTPDREKMTGSAQVGSGGEEYDVVDWEETKLDHVTWEDFLTNVARKWSEVRWVARRAYMTRNELIARFGEEVGKACPLNHKPANAPDRPEEREDPSCKAEVWECWDLPSRYVYWLCLDYPERALDSRKDPLGLTGFFPCPRPLLGTCGPDSTLPTPDVIYYQSQLRDIDQMTQRIGKLTDALKMRGFYAAGSQVGKDLQTLFDRDTNELIPVDSWAAFAEQGGVRGLIEWLPLDMVVSTIQTCTIVRKQLIEDVYQITGIADIMRGDNDPRETATAVRMKMTWGSSRVRSKQRDIIRFCRDAIELMGEVIASRFSAETLQKMTNIQLLKDRKAKAALQQQMQMQAQQRQMAMQAMQQRQAAQQAPPPQGPPGAPGPAAGAPPGPQPAPPPIPPEPPQQLLELLERPTWEDVTEMLRDEATRTFRIDIETDSTIEPDASETVERRVQVTQVLGLYLEKTIPLVQLYPAASSLIASTAKWLIQSMHAGREIEEDFARALKVFEGAMAGGAPAQAGDTGQGKDPAAQQASAKAQMVSAKASELTAQAKVQDAQTRQFEAQTDRMAKTEDIKTDRAQIAQRQQEVMVKAQEDRDYQRNDLMHQQHLESLRMQARDQARREQIGSRPDKIGNS